MATLRPTAVGFYAAIATVIPVLLVVYLVAVNNLVSKTLGPRLGQELAQYGARVNRVARRTPRSLRGVLASLRILVGREYWKSNLYMNVVMAVFVTAVVLPCLGEYEALHALYADRNSGSAKTFAFVGALTALLLVIAPLTYTTLKAFSAAVSDPDGRFVDSPASER